MLWLEEVPVPEVGSDEVFIRIKKTSICGTDVHIYNWDAWSQKTIPVPMVIGHEFVGVVERVGDHVKGFAPGDLVTGEGHITCGHCLAIFWPAGVSSLSKRARRRRRSAGRVCRIFVDPDG